MTKKKKKSGPRLTAEQRSAMAHDIKLGVLNNSEIGRNYGISSQAVLQARRRIMKDAPPKAPSVLDMKKALNLEKADSLLVYLMETTEECVKRMMNPNNDRFSPVTAMDTISRVGAWILNARNALAFAPVMDTGDGATELDMRAVNELMDKMPEELHGELLRILTGGGAEPEKAPEPKEAKA